MSQRYEVLEDADAQKLFDEFPAIDVAAVTEQVNALFTPYLFFRRERDGRVLLWSSCCRQHDSLGGRLVGQEEAAILYGKHNEKVNCPYCGRSVTLKNVGRLGKKKNLEEYHPVIILRAKGGDLYARCYWARKDYLDKLEDPPLFMNTNAMHFSIGQSEEVHETYYGKYACGVVEGNYDPVHRVITEPFTDRNYFYSPRYCSYYIFGLEEIEQSDFRYCQYTAFEYNKRDSEGRRLYGDLCKYLAAYSIYPRQIEMLMKTGGETLVWDLVVGRRKNRDIINWNAANPYDAFGLNKAELRAFRESRCGFWAIAQYKKLRRKKLITSFDSLRELEAALSGAVTEEFVGTCITRGLRPDKLRRYLERFAGGERYGVRYTLGRVFRDWKDYTVMAEKLNYDLTVETVLMPRDLDHAHQEAQEELNLKLAREERERRAAQAKEEKESIARRQKKYNIERGGWFIRIAESAEEITMEGRALRHCVGSYAERHMSGKTTILFLRRSEAPDMPVYTIQMDGERLIQVHGFGNDRMKDGTVAPNPRKTMSWILDPWLAWLETGSRRRKDGSPIIKVKTNQEAQSA